MNNRLLTWIGVGVGAVLLMSMRRGAVPITLVGGRMVARGCDPAGCGHFDAGRVGGRAHKGYDIVCVPGAQVFAPWAGTVERRVDPYGDGAYGGLQIRRSDGLVIKIMYFQPLASLVGKQVGAGQLIGYAQDIRRRYSSAMTPHLHIEIIQGGTHIDPAPYLF